MEGRTVWGSADQTSGADLEESEMTSRRMAGLPRLWVDQISGLDRAQSQLTYGMYFLSFFCTCTYMFMSMFSALLIFVLVGVTVLPGEMLANYWVL